MIACSVLIVFADIAEGCPIQVIGSMQFDSLNPIHFLQYGAIILVGTATAA